MKILFVIRIIFCFYFKVTSSLSWDATSDDEFPFKSVVDMLSENAEFSTFLRILQREGCIPFLNEHDNFTLIAPVNSAFVAVNEEEENFNIGNYILDNIVLLSSQVEKGTTVISENVRFPIIIERTIDDIIWINDASIVEPDVTPNIQNATIHGISNLLVDPPNATSLLNDLEAHYGKFHLFNSFLQGISKHFEFAYENNTLLIPLDANFYRYFNHIEINYILDYFGNLRMLEGDIKDNWYNDRERFLQNILSYGIHGGITAESVSSTNLNNQSLIFHSLRQGSALSVNNSAASSYSNMVFDRGIAHGFNNLEFLTKAFSFNTEKYLHGMNSSDFVKELYFRNLQRLVQDESLHTKMTIFVPETSLDHRFGFAKSNLLYHFTEAQLRLEREFSDTDGPAPTKMFKSAFCSSNKRLGGNCQRLKITKGSDGYYINEKYKVLHSKPYEVGKTLIYTISEDLRLPGDFISSLNPFYQCSKSLFFLKEIDLLNLVPNKEGYTILLPCFNSWEFLDLNLEYLQGNRTAVELIMKSLIFERLLYTDSENIDLETQNMLGETVSLSVDQVDNGDDKQVSLQLTNVAGNILLEKNLDVFFDQGVVHPLKHVYFPRAVKISLKDLIKTTGTLQYIDYLEKFQDLYSIINENEACSLLIPTASSLLMEGISMNSTKLYDFLKLHLIQANSTESILKCDGRVKTFLGESLVCRESSPGNFLLKVENGVDQEVRILRKGCSSFHNDSCVFLIDRPISLTWLNRERYHLKLPGVALGIGIVVGAISILGVSFCILVICVGKSHSWNKAPSRESSDGTEVSSPLLPSRTNESVSESRSGDHHEQRFESSYSSNAKRKPINVVKGPT